MSGKSHQPKSYTYICQHCGKEYHPKERDRNKYCSRECAFAHRAAKPREATRVICVVCGREFEGRPNRKYCSDECKKSMQCDEARERAIQKHSSEIEPIKCKECGKVFIPEYGVKRRKFCSEKCAQRNESKAPSAKMHKGSVSKARRLRVYKRDNYVCQLCGKPLMMDKADTLGYGKPHPLAPTVDHIVPCSIGKQMGWSNIEINSETNLQSAHFVCNVKKGNNIVGVENFM